MSTDLVPVQPASLTTTLVMMDPVEALAAVEDINRQRIGLAVRVLDFHEREGWKALGYTTMSSCIAERFRISRAYVNTLLDTGQALRVLSEPGTFIAINKIGADVTERLVRPIATAFRGQPIKIQRAWKQAQQVAGEGQKVKPKHVKAVVALLRDPDTDRPSTERKRDPSADLHRENVTPIPKPKGKRSKAASAQEVAEGTVGLLISAIQDFLDHCDLGEIATSIGSGMWERFDRILDDLNKSFDAGDKARDAAVEEAAGGD